MVNCAWKTHDWGQGLLLVEVMKGTGCVLEAACSREFGLQGLEAQAAACPCAVEASCCSLSTPYLASVAA